MGLSRYNLPDWTVPVYVSRRERLTSALAAGVVVAMTALGLMLGLRVTWDPRDTAALTSIRIAAPPSPEPERPKAPERRAERSAPKDSPAPPNLRSRATEVVAPPPRIVFPPRPVIVATKAASGNDVSSGAADRPGPGQGAGGIGTGTGGGGRGGDGSGYGAEVGPRHRKGRLRYSDLPERLLGPGEEAAVGVRFTVQTDGRVTNCRIDRSSGIGELDALVCRLIERRFRYDPARDREGHPVPATVVETHSWMIYPEEGE